MDWKQFLKPSKNKIVIFLILTFFLIFVSLGFILFLNKTKNTINQSLNINQQKIEEINIQRINYPYMGIKNKFINSSPQNQIKEGEIANIEGVYWDQGNIYKSIKYFIGKGSNPCLEKGKTIDVIGGSIIKATIKVIELKENICSPVEVINYEILYDRNQILDIANKNYYICQEIEKYINKGRKDNPIQLDNCLNSNNEGNFSELDYDWLSYKHRLIVYMEGYSPNKEKKHCTNIFEGAIIINPVLNKIEEIYLNDTQNEFCMPSY